MSKTWERPKLDIPKTKSEWLFDIAGYVMYIGAIIYLITIWEALPKEVPAHFNAFGEVDRWGSKWELLTLPCVGAIILLSLQLLERFPEVHNYPERFNEANARRFYLCSRQLINRIKNICLVIFSLIQLESILIALEKTDGLGTFYLPVLLITIFIPIIIAIYQFKKIK